MLIGVAIAIQDIAATTLQLGRLGRADTVNRPQPSETGQGVEDSEVNFISLPWQAFQALAASKIASATSSGRSRCKPWPHFSSITSLQQ